MQFCLQMQTMWSLARIHSTTCYVWRLVQWLQYPVNAKPLLQGPGFRFVLTIATLIHLKECFFFYSGALIMRASVLGNGCRKMLWASQCCFTVQSLYWNYNFCHIVQKMSYWIMHTFVGSEEQRHNYFFVRGLLKCGQLYRCLKKMSRWGFCASKGKLGGRYIVAVSYFQYLNIAMLC